MILLPFKTAATIVFVPAEVFLGDADFILISAELTFGSYTHKGLWEMNEKKKRGP